MPRTALEDLCVVDLTDLRGALAGRMLAELGADVIKVEPPQGDPGRLRPPFAGKSRHPIARCHFSTAMPASAAR